MRNAGFYWSRERPKLFFVDVICFMFWWIFAVPLFSGIGLPPLDPSGGLVGFQRAMQTCGLALARHCGDIVRHRPLLGN